LSDKKSTRRFCNGSRNEQKTIENHVFSWNTMFLIHFLNIFGHTTGNQNLISARHVSHQKFNSQTGVSIFGDRKMIKKSSKITYFHAKNTMFLINFLNSFGHATGNQILISARHV
jgi:hypothetical protein